MEPKEIELNNNYVCVGHFYKLELLNKEFICRSVLDILRNEVLKLQYQRYY